MTNVLDNLGEHARNGPGRPKGSKNRLTKMIERVYDAAETLDETDGGEEKNWLLQQARLRPQLFIQLYQKLLPSKAEVDQTNRDAAPDISELPAAEQEKLLRQTYQALKVYLGAGEQGDDNG